MKGSASPFTILAASSLGTLCSSIVGNPLDVVKTRQMMGDSESMTDTFKLIIKAEGTRVLLSGVAPTLVVGAAGNACYFLLYESLKWKAVALVGKCGFGATAFFSRLASVTLLIPVEVIRTRAYAGSAGSKANLCRGLLSQVCRDILWSVICWQLYEFIVPSDPSILLIVLGAVIGAIVASALTHPLDFLKTKQQVDCSLSENPIIGLKQLWGSQGMKVVTKGLAVHCLEAAVAIVVFILLYTQAIALLSS